jgi:hypothetical protein
MCDSGSSYLSRSAMPASTAGSSHTHTHTCSCLCRVGRRVRVPPCVRCSSWLLVHAQLQFHPYLCPAATRRPPA